MQTKKKEKRKTVCRETHCVFASTGNCMSCSIFLFAPRDGLKMEEKATSLPRKCVDEFSFTLFMRSSKDFYDVAVCKENNRQQSLWCQGHNQFHTAHEAHCRKKVGQSGNFALKRWNSVWKPANSEKIWPFRAPIVGSERRIRPKRGGLARHSVESPQSLSASANPQRKRKDKVKWMDHQMNELEEFHLSERVQGSVKTTESTQRSRRPGGKLEVSRGRIEVLIGGPTCCFLNKERLRWTDWGDYSHHKDWKWWDPCIPNTSPNWVHLRGGWSSKWKLCSRTSIIVTILSGSSTVASVWWNLWFCSPSQAQVVGFLLVNKKINNCHQLRGLLYFMTITAVWNAHMDTGSPT